MNYLVSKFACVLVQEKIIEVLPNVKYLVENVEKPFLVFGKNDEDCQLIDLSCAQKNILKFHHGNNNYFFMSAKKRVVATCVNFEFNKRHISVSISSGLVIAIDGNIKLNEKVEDVEYSTFETVSNFCVIYFSGKRNYVVIIEEDKVIAKSYYDECNIKNEERIFMCRLYDGLNHGKVFHIKDKKVENYLVYLDDYDLNLKPQFVPYIFLDCVKAGNYKYCNNLLCDALKQDKEISIKEFFPDFDEFFNLEENDFVLIKKNTLAGIYKFEVENGLISNIISC